MSGKNCSGFVIRVTRTLGTALQSADHRACAVNEEHAQIDITALGYAQQPGLAARGVRAWHQARASGHLAAGEEGARLENACAAMLLKHAHYLQDVEGRAVTLHYIRDKEGNEVDLVLCRNNVPVLLAECRHSVTAVSRFLAGLAARYPKAQAFQVVRELRQEEKRGEVSIVRAADWLAELAA